MTLPEASLRHGASTWQIDVYDGLRRRQACMYGHQTRTAAADAATVELDCVLRPVRAWSEPWANDPLPGSYYVRLTVLDLPDTDLGQPIGARVEATSIDAGSAHDVDGTLSEPLVPGSSAVRAAAGSGASASPRTARRTSRSWWPAASRRTAGPPAGGRSAGCGARAERCSPPWPVSSATP